MSAHDHPMALPHVHGGARDDSRVVDHVGQVRGRRSELPFPGDLTDPSGGQIHPELVRGRSSDEIVAEVARLEDVAGELAATIRETEAESHEAIKRARAANARAEPLRQELRRLDARIPTERDAANAAFHAERYERERRERERTRD